MIQCEHTMSGGYIHGQLKSRDTHNNVTKSKLRIPKCHVTDLI